MPKKGERATVCKRGHDLTLPDARLSVPSSGRGGGGCRVCLVEKTRQTRGSSKTGPSSPYRGNEVERLAALARGLKRCPKCEQAKELTEFWNDRHTFDGKGAYCKACASAGKRADYAERREELLIRAQARKFGVTVADLKRLLSEQDHLCAICRRACISGRSLAVDHDHDTDAVRGLLCANCNRAIGLLQDSIEVTESAARYLRRWKSDGQEGVRRG